MIRFALAISLLLFSVPQAIACSETETFLFTCPTDSPDRSLGLCGNEEDTGEGLHMTGLRFVYQTEKGEEIAYPDNPADGPKSLFFSHQFKAGLYRASVRFEKDGLSYRLIYKDTPPIDDPVTTGALEISKEGKVIQTIACGETPVMYTEKTRTLVSCDMQNTFGQAGCAQTPPKEP